MEGFHVIDRRFVPLLMSRSAIEGQHLLVIYYFAIPRSSLTEVVCHVDSLVDYRRQSTFLEFPCSRQMLQLFTWLQWFVGSG